MIVFRFHEPRRNYAYTAFFLHSHDIFFCHFTKWGKYTQFYLVQKKERVKGCTIGEEKKDRLQSGKTKKKGKRIILSAEQRKDVFKRK